ncbi:MAG TPA: DNA recombination protein RmuC [Syntrophomonadaceae bacterium]|nr:DNA recombination protein RmuC [Syntrophomonadaceae bacterium]
MENIQIWIFLIIGILSGSLLGWFISKSKLTTEKDKLEMQLGVMADKYKEKANKLEVIETEADELRMKNSSLMENKVRLETRNEESTKAYEEKLALLNRAQVELSDAFKVLSAEALQTNNQSFLELAKTTLEKYQEGAKNDLEMRKNSIDQLVLPIKESLQKVDLKIEQLEKARTSAYSSLNEQVKSMANQQMLLHGETSNLVKALRTPHVRGRWGEMQLKRVVEIAGMLEYCDFLLQESVNTQDGRLRPDMVVKLPNHKNIVVDSKVPLMAYLEAIDAKDDVIREEKFKNHAKQVKTHINQLAAKSYWSQFQPSPEFVVLFLPGESFFSAALESDPSLIEYSANEQVILATPTTLIALLRAVSFGWRQEQLAENAQAISELGATLYSRLNILANHFGDVGKGLNRTVQSYNRTIGSFESRVLVSARRFKELGASGEEDIESLEIIESIARDINGELDNEPEVG